MTYPIVIILLLYLFKQCFAERFKWFRVVERTDRNNEKVYIVEEMNLKTPGLWKKLREFYNTDEAFDYYLLLKSKTNNKDNEDIYISDL